MLQPDHSREWFNCVEDADAPLLQYLFTHHNWSIQSRNTLINAGLGGIDNQMLNLGVISFLSFLSVGKFASAILYFLLRPLN